MKNTRRLRSKSGAEKAWTQIKEQASWHGEHRDCTVKAMALTTGCSYLTALAALKAAGRRKRCGFDLDKLVQAIRKLGWGVAEQSRPAKAKTLKTVGAELPHGCYIVATYGHVAALINGHVVDWAADTRKRVQVIYKIYPI